jgi:pimeloyl-ACP methyl ester carboxylesterase
MKANALTVSPNDKSTNVRLTQRPRSSASRKPSDLVRNAFQILSLVAPHLAATWAAKKFLTPPPARPLSPKSRAFLASADDRFTIRLDTNLRGTRDTSLVQVSLWGRGPAVYMLHGWGGRGTQWAAFVPPLVDAGYTAVVLDAPGHGESPAPRTSIVHFAAALATVVESVGPAWCAMGHSLGGAAAALAMKRGLPCDNAVLFGAPADPAAYFDLFLGRIGIPARLHPLIKNDVEQRYGFEWKQFAVSPPKRDTDEPEVPALIVHDSADADVELANARRIADAWPGAEVMTTHGLGHHRILTDAEVVRSVVSWLSRGASDASASPTVLG